MTLPCARYLVRLVGPDGDHIPSARDMASARMGPLSCGVARGFSQGQILHLSGELQTEPSGNASGACRLASMASRQRGLSRSGVFSCGGADIMSGGSQLQSQTHEALQQLGVVHVTSPGDQLHGTHAHGSGQPASPPVSKQA